MVKSELKKIAASWLADRLGGYSYLNFRYSLYSFFPYNVEKQRLKQLVTCNEPIIAIGSIMRSGGNLLNRLFDNHPQLRTYHAERLFSVLSDFTLDGKNIKISKFPYYNELRNFDQIFRDFIKHDMYLQIAAFKGFVKVNYDNPLPFIYKRRLHKKIFLSLCKRNSSSMRNVLNNYITGFFNAYMDYQSLYGTDKKYTTTYWPGFVLFEENVEKFLSVYPDGVIIHIFRDPLSWAGSAKKRAPDKFSKEYMDDLWLSSTKNGIFFKKRYPNNYICVDFNDLVTQTRKTMAILCDLLGIRYADSLVYPTFNGISIAANSVYEENQRQGIISDVLDAYKKVLSEDEILLLKRHYGDVYKEAKNLTVSQ